jgi:hypothetical protein
MRCYWKGALFLFRRRGALACEARGISVMKDFSGSVSISMSISFLWSTKFSDLLGKDEFVIFK